MPPLPSDYLTLFQTFAPLFSNAVWVQAQVLLVGAILTTGKGTVTAGLRIMGLSTEVHFQNYHRVLNRAVWSSRQASYLLLGLLIAACAPTGPVLIGIDDTIERRRGEKIKAKGIYRDPVRSSHSHFVKASGLRWLSMMLLVPIPWAQHVWALPFLTVLAPSERYFESRGRSHKKLTDWARQMILQVRRWVPQRQVVVVADSSFAVLELLAGAWHLANPVAMITRFRLDAALYAPAPAERRPGQKGRTPVKGIRLPTLEQVAGNPKTHWKRVTIPDWYGEGQREVELVSATAVWYHAGEPPVALRWVLIRDPRGKFKTQALLCTDLKIEAVQILKWFVLRWQLEVTFREVREHLGVETQRQWSDWAIVRTTPALLGLFAVITLLAHRSTVKGKLPVRQAAWYVKRVPTFSDALATVRQQIWRQLGFPTSDSKTDMVKMPGDLFLRLTEALCYTT